MTPTLINGEYPIVLPDFRKEFHDARPNWERGRLAHAREHLQPGMRVFDIGAEHGDFTALYQSWVGQDGSVIPVEPSVRYWPCIKATYEANAFPAPPWSFVGFAADGTSDVVQVCKGWPIQTHGEVVADPGFCHLAQQADSIPSIAVDDLAYLVGDPDVLMIDVEGAEWHVLKGAEGALRNRPVLVNVSVHEPTMLDWYGRTLADLHELMHDYGYSGEELPHFGEGETFWVYR